MGSNKGRPSLSLSLIVLSYLHLFKFSYVIRWPRIDLVNIFYLVELSLLIHAYLLGI